MLNSYNIMATFFGDSGNSNICVNCTLCHTNIYGDGKGFGNESI